MSLSRLRENRILRILDSKDPKDQRVLSDPQLPRIQDFLDHSSQVHFQKVMEGLKTLEIPFSLDHRLVRGLDYYSHTTFEFLALDPKSGGLGPQQSTVIAGGRYANLIRELGGELDKSGIGWAAGVERLAVLQESLSIALEPGRLDVMLVLLPRKSNHLNESCDLENCALRICNELRRSGLFVDMRLQGSVREQLSLANTFGAKFAVIIGAQEFSKGYVAVKNLDSRVQEEIPLADLVESLKSRVCS